MPIFAKPRLRTILIAVNLAILVLPLSGIGVLRIYESALVRQTESELIAQSAFISAAYLASFERVWPSRKNKNQKLDAYGLPAAFDATSDNDSPWRPRPPVLDLAVDPILPSAPDGIASNNADPLAIASGKDITGLIKKAQITTLASIRILDYRGIVVATTGNELGEQLTDRKEIQLALQGKPASLMRQRISDQPIPTFSRISRNTGVRVFVSSPIVLNSRIVGIVSLSRTPKNIWHAMNEKRLILFYTSLVLFAIVVVVSLITSLKIGRPIHALIEQAEQAARGEKGAVTVLQKPGSWEVEQLSEAVSTMAKNLEQRADYIRGFAAHVSHEFKTPLTSIQGALELLSEHADTMSEAERKRFLSNLMQDSHRLERLVAALLELAKADTVRHSGEVTDLTETIEPFIERYWDNGADVALKTTTTGPLPVLMEQDSLITIISNLLDNALQHGGKTVRINVSIGKDEITSQVNLTVSDNGPGISSANIERIFDPFFTSARNQGGTGLGLSIVRSLLSAHGGKINYVPTETGCTFRLTFPTPRSI